MLYLVPGEIRKSEYMRDEPKIEVVTHPVEAESEREAQEIFEEHFRNQSRPYDVSYIVYVSDVRETLFKSKV